MPHRRVIGNVVTSGACAARRLEPQTVALSCRSLAARERTGRADRSDVIKTGPGVQSGMATTNGEAGNAGASSGRCHRPRSDWPSQPCQADTVPT